MTICICIPAYNEVGIIQQAVKSIRATVEHNKTLEWRIIVVDNASTDGTAEAVRSMGDKRVTVLELPAKGKGRAVRSAALTCKEEMFAFIDADLSADPRDMLTLIQTVETGRADIAIGSRLLNEHMVRRSLLRTATSKLFNVLRRSVLGIKVHDSQCGLKVMNKKGVELLTACKEDGWFLDIELLARAEKMGLRIKEIPIHWNEFRFADRPSKLNIITDGVRAAVALVRIRVRTYNAY